MTMPINLLFVRHGQSEGNLANKLSRSGDHSAFTEEFKNRPSSSWRLTDLGIEQAKASAKWIKENIDFPFDRKYVSSYYRAMETAWHLHLGGIWLKEPYLRESDWGSLDVMSHEERLHDFGSEMARRRRDGITWAPPGGESIVNLGLRIDRMLDTFHRELSDKNGIVVNHGYVTRAFQWRIERFGDEKLAELINDAPPEEELYNCQIVHYTRRHPETKELARFMTHVRSICPWDLSKTPTGWREIHRARYTEDDLQRIFESQPCQLFE